MQLKGVILLLCIPIFGLTQNNKQKVLDETEVNFLFNYYEQEGNHSPVTGGVGSEELECFAPLMVINVPFDTVHNINVALGLDYYTSASSDQIDRFITAASSQYLSSASSKDLRPHADISYTYANPNKHFSFGMMTGYSREFDVTSISSGLNYSKSSKNQNTEFALKASLYHDTWLLIYPGETRNGDEYLYGNNENDYDIDKRMTYTFSISLMQVVTKKLHFLVVSDVVMQRGILNTPFHRVYFDDGFDVPDSLLFMKTMYPENLPRARNKFPFGIRANYYFNDKLIIRTFFRYYFDDFDMKAKTISIELPIRISHWLTIYPLYRYHEQTASKYFAPFAEHELDFSTWKPKNEFYTSDWDQAAIINRKYGAGFRLYPYKGILKIPLSNKRKVLLKSFDFRFSHYNRSDGLKANSFSFDLAFGIH